MVYCGSLSGFILMMDMEEVFFCPVSCLAKLPKSAYLKSVAVCVWLINLKSTFVRAPICAWPRFQKCLRQSYFFQLLKSATTQKHSFPPLKSWPKKPQLSKISTFGIPEAWLNRV